MINENFVIGKKIFANASTFYGLELNLQGIKYKTFYVNEGNVHGCDLLLISLFWYKDIFLFEDFLRKTGLKNRKDLKILAGGMQTTATPELVAEMADYVFIGDGEDHLLDIIEDIKNNKIPECEYIYYKGKKSIPKPYNTNELKPFLYKIHGTKKIEAARKKKERIKQNYDSKKVSSIYRIEIARGCKFKCPFCMLSGMKKYREVKTEEILKLLDTIPKNKTIACFAPERTLHSGWNQIVAKIKERELKDFGQDVRLENIEKSHTDSAIMGLEGISYKLRKSINKNYTDDFIIQKMEQFVTTGRRKIYGGHLGCYYIADLPDENKTDWKELYDFFKRLETYQWSRNLTIAPVLNPLSPKPFTTFKDVDIHPFINYDRIWKTFMRGGDGNSRWGIKLKEYSIWGCWERVTDTLIHRGKGSKTYKLIEKIPSQLLLHNINDYNKSVIVCKDFIKLFEKVGLNPKVIYGEDYLRTEIL